MLAGDYKGFINMCVKHCPRCEGELVLTEIIETPLLSLKQVTGVESRSFYGGNVVKFSLTRCKHCSAEILLYLKSINNGYKIHDVAISKESLDSEYKLQDNEVEEAEAVGAVGAVADEAKTQEETPVNAKFIMPKKRVADSIGNVEINVLHAKNILEGIKENDLDKVLHAMDNIHFGYLPKTLAGAGVPKLIVYTEEGKIKKKAEYMTLMTNYINEAKAAMADAKTESVKEQANDDEKEA